MRFVSQMPIHSSTNSTHPVARAVVEAFVNAAVVEAVDEAAVTAVVTKLTFSMTQTSLKILGILI